MSTTDKPLTARVASELVLTERIAAIHAASEGRYGAPRVYDTLIDQGCEVPYRTVRRLMGAAGLSGTRERKRQTAEIDYAPNLLARDFDVRRLDRVWAADITYVPTADGWLYLAAMLDLCSRRVVGWSMSTTADTRLALAALDMAVMDRLPERGLLHHTDRGVQYTAAEYQSALKRYGFRVSMSKRGNCLDNAVVESFFSTLKRELTRKLARKPRSEVQAAIDHWIGCTYNATRKHSALGYVSPLQFERARREQARKRRKR